MSVLIPAAPPARTAGTLGRRGVCAVAEAKRPGLVAGGSTARGRGVFSARRLPFIAMSGVCGERQKSAGALPQRAERGAQFVGEELRFFPCCKVAAPVGLVEVDEVGIDLFGPAPG